MTAKEEDILADQNLMKKGLTIDRLLRNVIVDRSINPDDLLIGDKNAILVATRIGGYGPEYDTKVICPVCYAHGKHEFDLSEVKINFQESLEEIDVRSSGDGTFFVTTPRTNVEIELRLLNGRDEKKTKLACASINRPIEDYYKVCWWTRGQTNCQSVC